MADLVLPYIPAKAHGGTLTTQRLWVCHSTEGPMSRGNARALAGPAWFGGPAGTSAHAIFDPGEGVEMVKPSIVAYHVGPGGNGFTLGSEHCGKVALTKAEWLSADGVAMLRRSAQWTAQYCKRYSIEPRWGKLPELAAGAHVMCTHNDIRLVFGGTTHSDPGPNFPYGEYQEWTQDFYYGREVDDLSQADAMAALKDFFNATEIAVPHGQSNNNNFIANLTSAYQSEVNRDNAQNSAILALAQTATDTKSAVTALAGSVNTAGMSDAQVAALAAQLAPHLRVDKADLEAALKAAVTDLVAG